MPSGRNVNGFLHIKTVAVAKNENLILGNYLPPDDDRSRLEAALDEDEEDAYANELFRLREEVKVVKDDIAAFNSKPDQDFTLAWNKEKEIANAAISKAQSSKVLQRTEEDWQKAYDKKKKKTEFEKWKKNALKAPENKLTEAKNALEAIDSLPK